LKISSLAAAIKTVYECVTSGEIAHIAINTIPVHIQLPPSHRRSTHDELDNEDEQQVLDSLLVDEAEAGNYDAVGRHLDRIEFGWRLAPLLPWKALVLLDDHDSMEGLWNGNRKLDPLDDKTPEGMLGKFVAMISPTLSYVPLKRIDHG